MPNGVVEMEIDVAVGLSFDVDNATATLSTGNLDYEILSRGEYGAVDGLPRILRMMSRAATTPTVGDQITTLLTGFTLTMEWTK